MERVADHEGAQLRPRGLGFAELALDESGVGLVDVDRRTRAQPQVLGQADVIGVTVGEDDRRDVPVGLSEARQELVDLARVPLDAGIDERHPAPVDQAVEVDVAAAEPMQPPRELHGPNPKSPGTSRRPRCVQRSSSKHGPSKEGVTCVGG